MAKKTFKKGLSLILAIIMVVSLFNMAVLAAGTSDDPYDIGDVVYTADRNTQPTGAKVADSKWQYVKSYDEEWDCGKNEHKHYFGCGSIVGTCAGEHDHEDDGCTLIQPARAEWKLVENVSNNKAEHLDIHINLTAKYTVDGKAYDASVILTGADYTSGRLTITSTGNRHSITRHGDSVDAGQYRFHGTFPVGTSSNPVNYTITLVKDVDFNVEGETVTVPMTFSKTVNYWSGNICESLLATRGYKDGSWAAGEFVGGHMDFKLGASEATGTTNPVDPTPEEPAKYTVTVQKNVSGIALESAKTYSFGIYSGNDKIDTVEVTVPAGGSTAIGTIALEEDISYFVVEEGSPAIEGYDLATTSAVGSGDAKDGVTSDSFTVTGDTSVVFTNSYKAEEVIPPAPPVTYDYTVVADYYTNGVKDNDASVALGGENDVLDIPAEASIEASFAYGNVFYGGNTYTYTSISFANNVFTLRYDRTYVEPPVPVEYTLVTNWINEEGKALAESVSETKNEGDNYATEAKSFEGYELKDTSGDAVSGTMDGNKEVTYIYKAKEVTPPEPPAPPAPVNYTITIKHVDEEGNDLVKVSTVTGPLAGISYNSSVKEIEGYTFKEMHADSDPATGVVVDRDITVIYVYKAKEVTPPEPPAPPVPTTYTLVTNWVSESGKVLADSTTETLNEGDAYSTVQKSFSGYTFSKITGDAANGTMDSDKEVTYVYKVKKVTPPVTPPVEPIYYNLTVNYLDEAGNVLAPQVYVERILHGELYTTEQLTIEGYEFKENTGDAKIGYIHKNTVVNYIYTAIEAPVVPEEPVVTPEEPVVTPDEPVVTPEEPAEVPDEEPIEIADEDVPLAEIPDEDVPLADVPKTGDEILLYALLASLSGAALIGVNLTGRKKAETEEE